MAEKPTTNKAPTKMQGYSSDAPAGQPQSSGGRAPSKRQPKKSVYGQQLMEKQAARKEYGLRERQFRTYFQRAHKSTVATGQALMGELETRLDNIVYRLGLAKTRRQARQMISHRLVKVNDHKVNIPSYQIGAGDVITLVKPDIIEYNKEAEIPSWLKCDPKKMVGTVVRMPKAEDLQTDLNTQLIVEYYSR